MKKLFPLFALLMMTMVSWAQELIPNYLTLTVNEGSGIFMVYLHYAYDGDGTPDRYGKPSENHPKIMFSINDGEWFSLQDYDNIYVDGDGYWTGYLEGPTLTKGDVLRIKGNNTSLSDFTTGSVWLDFVCNPDEDHFSLTRTGNPSSLFDGGGYSNVAPDITAFIRNGSHDIKTLIAEITIDGVTIPCVGVESFVETVHDFSLNEISIKLLADCDLGDYSINNLSLLPIPTTFDLNGYTFKGSIETSSSTITINDSSEGKTGKVVADNDHAALTICGEATINGGTFEGLYSINLYGSSKVTLNGGTFRSSSTEGAFSFDSDYDMIIIPDGYEYTDGNGNPVSGTITKASDKVTFAGSVQKKQTATAVDNINAQNTQKTIKTIKTIENGEIVIIRGGERFNLRGAKIE